MATPRSPRAVPAAASGRLEALLRDLGASVTRGGHEPPPGGFSPTGLTALDRALGGGFPRGRVSEVVGPGCCGRTSLALALLAHTTARGELGVVVDPADAFDVVSATSAGVDLERVLWVRPRSVPEALRSVEHVLLAGGFPLVLLDLCTEGAPPQVAPSAWPRLRKATAAAASALVLLGHRRLAGTFADLALELDPSRPRFEDGPDWLAGVETRARLVRSRSGPTDVEVAMRWPVAETAGQPVAETAGAVHHPHRAPAAGEAARPSAA